MYLYSLLKQFLYGKNNLRTPEGLRPAKITFSGEDNKKAITKSKRNVKFTLDADER